MNHGGEASEQVVRIMLEGTEVALRLTGSATKNVAATLYAFYKDNKTTKGKTTMTRILKEGKETRIFRMETKDLAEFKSQAKKYGIMYVAIKDKNSTDGLCDVIIKSEDISKVNHVLGKMDYVTMNHTDASQSVENDEPKKESQQRYNSNTPKTKSMQKDNQIKSVNVEQIIKDIQNNKKENITPEAYKAYLALQSQLHQYSPKNKERIFEQLPSASVVMSKTKWREVGRYPKQGAKGIAITMPEFQDGKRTGNFINATIYDISETYGKELHQSSYALQLQDNTPEIKDEIERIKTSSTVPISINPDLETDAYYDDQAKTIFIRDDLSDTDTYKALVLEQTYANAHAEQGAEYIRGNHRLMAESTAYMVATKYGIDTQEYSFDYIPDEVNGNDGKDLSEFFAPITTKGSDEIKKADKNLEKYKKKEKPSVKQELASHKKALESKTFQAERTPTPPTKAKGR